MTQTEMTTTTEASATAASARASEARAQGLRAVITPTAEGGWAVDYAAQRGPSGRRDAPLA